MPRRGPEPRSGGGAGAAERALPLPGGATTAVASFTGGAASGRPARSLSLVATLIGAAGVGAGIGARTRARRSLPDRRRGWGRQTGPAGGGGGESLAPESIDQPARSNGSAARSPDRCRQLDVVGDDERCRSLDAQARVDEMNNELVGGRAPGIANLHARGDVSGHETVLRRAVEDDGDSDARRHDGAQPADQGRRREWLRRPPDRVQHVGAIDDEASDPLEYAAIVRHAAAPLEMWRRPWRRPVPHPEPHPRRPHPRGALTACPVASHPCSC